MFIITLLLLATVGVSDVPVVDYDVALDVVQSGYDKEQCWVHARAGVIPGELPVAVMTTQKLQLSGSDIFYGLNVFRKKVGEGAWEGPVEQPTFLRRHNQDGTETVVCDFSPKWHDASGTLLGTGHTAQYQGDKLVHNRRRATAYAVYDAKKGEFLPWKTLEMPTTVDPVDDDIFFNSGAGSTQRVDLLEGDILLPVYHKAKEATYYNSSVLRCAFDGETLSVREFGNALSVPIKRGLYEPSLAAFQGRYYLTLRNDDNGYVAVSEDGLHFGEPRIWTFDDGMPLGNYNTQQHWAVHRDGLFLVYTRRGANNDHVFRHRAPLFMAQIEPENLCVIRATERILVPERGARLGNFGVTRVSDTETWVTVTEWMQPAGCEEHGSDNSIYVARICWK